jgi:hypothetical protein
VSSPRQSCDDLTAAATRHQASGLGESTEELTSKAQIGVFPRGQNAGRQAYGRAGRPGHEWAVKPWLSIDVDLSRQPQLRRE